MTITKITANSDNKNDVYRLLNIVHSMAGSMAVAKLGGWSLKDTCTMSPEYVQTTWTNGIVDVRAVTTDLVHHEYSLYATTETHHG